jgi:hypothetical protein
MLKRTELAFLDHRTFFWSRFGSNSTSTRKETLIAEPGRRSKDGNLVPDDWINAGHRRTGDGHLLDCCGSEGTLYGEGQGVMILKDGKMATWTGHGVGTMRKDGTASFRGAVYYQTAPPRWA